MQHAEFHAPFFHSGFDKMDHFRATVTGVTETLTQALAQLSDTGQPLQEDVAELKAVRELQGEGECAKYKERYHTTRMALMVAEGRNKTADELHALMAATVRENAKLVLELKTQRERCQTLEALEKSRTATAAAVGRTGELQLMTVLRRS